jgi:hypothetical protein
LAVDTIVYAAAPSATVHIQADCQPLPSRTAKARGRWQQRRAAVGQRTMGPLSLHRCLAPVLTATCQLLLLLLLLLLLQLPPFAAMPWRRAAGTTGRQVEGRAGGQAGRQAGERAHCQVGQRCPTSADNDRAASARPHLALLPLVSTCHPAAMTPALLPGCMRACMHGYIPGAARAARWPPHAAAARGLPPSAPAAPPAPLQAPAPGRSVHAGHLKAGRPRPRHSKAWTGTGHGEAAQGRQRAVGASQGVTAYQ